MKVDIDIEEDIEIGFDEGVKDIILTLKGVTDYDSELPLFTVSLHMSMEIFDLLKKEINEFGSEE